MKSRAIICGPLVVACLLSVYATASSAATFTPVPSPMGKQCGVSDINNGGDTVGGCTSSNPSGADVAWYALRGGSQTALSTLVQGKPCAAMGITNGDVIFGSCMDTNGQPQAVSWSSPSASPVKFSPRSALLSNGVIASLAAYNQHGDAAGYSLAGSRSSTAVVWQQGSTSPLVVASNLLGGILGLDYDNCGVVDITEPTSGLPPVAMNCPRTSDGGNQAVVALPASSNSYTLQNLALPPGAVQCSVSGINTSRNTVGTCIYLPDNTATPAVTITKMAFWPTPTSAPTVVSLLANGSPLNNAGAAINDSGNMVMSYERIDGHSGVAYVAVGPGMSNPVTTLVPPESPGTGIVATAFANNNAIALLGQDSNGYAHPALFNADGALTEALVPFLSGGTHAVISVLSQDGSKGAGSAEDSTHTDDAVTLTLP